MSRPSHGVWRRRLRWSLLIVVILMIALRAVLPEITRRVLISQVNAAVTGTLEIGDVDLSLLRGRVALVDVAFTPERAEGAPSTLVAWHRLAVDLSWPALVDRSVRLQDIDLTGLEVSLDRLQGGELLLPVLRTPGDTPEPEDPEPSGAPWAVTIDRIGMQGGALHVRDQVATPPVTRDLRLPTLVLTNLNLQPTPDGQPGRGRIRIVRDDGVIDARTKVRSMADGFDLALRLGFDGFPLTGAHAHLPALGWQDFAGTLDGSVTVHLRPDASLTAAGAIEISDLAVTVPDETAPALAFKRFAIELAELDLAHRRAHVKRVQLDGARLLVHPNSASPLPLLIVPADPATPVAPVEPSDAGEAAPWRWRVDRVDVRDARADITLGEVLGLRLVEATLSDLTSKADTPAHLVATLAEGDGTVGLNGTFTLTPPRGTLTIELAGIDTGRLAAATGGAPLPHSGGLLAGKLQVAATQEPVTVSGTLSLADVAIADADAATDFRVAWKNLEVVIASVTLPGVLPETTLQVAAPTTVALERVTLDAPRLTLTRDADGIRLPETNAPDADADTPDSVPSSATPAASPPPPEADANALVGNIAQLVVHGGEVAVTDRTVQPPYSGTVRRLEVDARNIRFPANSAERATVSLRPPRGGRLTITTRQRGQQIHVETKLDDLPLRQFMPYVSSTGYEIGAGSLGLESTTDWRDGEIESENTVNLDGLVVTGTQGAALFQKRFGVPLSVGLALLRDLDGRISMGIPVRSDAGGVQVDIASIVGQALTRAITGALISPLKLLGAVKLTGDRIETFSPKPIRYQAGTSTMTSKAAKTVDGLVHTLASLPGLHIELRGTAGSRDQRALALGVVREKVEDDGFFTGVRDFFTGGARTAIRDALSPEDEAAMSDLDEGDRAKLETLITEAEVDPEALHTLAAARAEALRALLVDERGIAATRIAVVEPHVDLTHGTAEVQVELGASAVEEAAPDAG